MAHATDIVGYTWQVDHHCPTCMVLLIGTYPGSTAEEVLDGAARAEGVNRFDESSFDSGSVGDWGEPNPLVFPKVVFRSMLDGSERCAECGELLSEAYPTGTDPLPRKEPS